MRHYARTLPSCGTGLRPLCRATLSAFGIGLPVLFPDANDGIAPRIAGLVLGLLIPPLQPRPRIGGELRVGKRVEEFTATELADAQKPDVLRAYLRRWKFEVGVFFDGVDASAPDEKLLEIAPGYPVFLIG